MAIPKTLILIRHAHRDKPFGSSGDNGLSPKGREQAAAITRHFAKRWTEDWAPQLGNARPFVLTSAKLRCRETIEGIGQVTGTAPRDEPLLMEERPGEGAADLHARIQSFCDGWREAGPALTVACSHGDWLPLALEKLTGTGHGMSKGAWAEIVERNGEPELVRILQLA